MRTCTKCAQELALTEFYWNNYGRERICKECKKRAVAEWRECNRERYHETARKWRDANRAKITQINHEQYKNNKPGRDAYSKAWAQANPEKCRAAEKKWRQKPQSRALTSEKAKRWRSAHPEAAQAAERRWRQAHPDKICQFAKTRRARKAGAPINDFTATQWKAMQQVFQHRCAYCDKRCKGRLTQDHILPLSKGGAHTASNIVPACASCNSRKHTGPPLRPVQPTLL